MPAFHANSLLTMKVWYIYTVWTFTKYSCNKNCTIPYLIDLISNRANFAVRDPTSFSMYFHACITSQWRSAWFCIAINMNLLLLRWFVSIVWLISALYWEELYLLSMHYSVLPLSSQFKEWAIPNLTIPCVDLIMDEIKKSLLSFYYFIILSKRKGNVV